MWLMGIELQWDERLAGVMLARVGSRWTWAAFERAVQAAHDAHRDPAVHFEAAIIDLSRGVRLPDPLWSARTMRYARWAAEKAPPGGTGPVVIVGVSDAVRLLYEPLRRLFPHATANVHLARHISDARCFIAEWLAADRPA